MTFTVPEYRLERRLGQGSQGEVWLAEHLTSRDRVALKWIPLGRPGAADVARTEAALLARLDHPNLIALREFRILESGFVLVLELADAGSLANLLRRRDKLTPAEVVATVSPVAAALAHAHDSRVLHGDISPANILFTTAGHPKLADLGLARLVSGIGTGTGLGTPAYLDPVIAAGGPAGLPSDVFSLAAVSLHALTGTGPWRCRGTEQPSADDIMAIAATGRIEDLEARLAAVPPAMTAVLTRALDQDPSRRGTAAEFALDIRAALPPTPVVLAGGRITAPTGRHAARHRSATSGGPVVDRDAAAQGSVAVIARPARNGPADQALSDGLEFVPADLTRVSRPLVRAVPTSIAEPESSGLVGRIRDRMVGGSRLRAAAVIALAGLLIAAGVIGWPLVHPHDPAVASGRPPATTAQQLTAGQLDPVALLTHLDDLRAQAYAERRPDLLAGIYASATLVATDTATLQRTVPSGCRLTGLHTVYRNPHVVQQAAQTITLTVQASLPSATLTCAGRSPIRTHALAARMLTVELSRATTTTGFRIAQQSVG